jgi:hypothetical protein
MLEFNFDDVSESLKASQVRIFTEDARRIRQYLLCFGVYVAMSVTYGDVYHVMYGRPQVPKVPTDMMPDTTENRLYALKLLHKLYKLQRSLEYWGARVSIKVAYQHELDDRDPPRIVERDTTPAPTL